MISGELSNALFGFSLRCLGAALEGGGVQPPPGMSWKIHTASRARVNPYPVWVGGGGGWRTKRLPPLTFR